MSSFKAKFTQVCLKPIIKDLGSITQAFFAVMQTCFIYTSAWVPLCCPWDLECEKNQGKRDPHVACCAICNIVLCLRSRSLIPSASIHETMAN